MAAWSHSPFLQALGWAMLNSFWQMALLFAGFTLLQQLFSFSVQRRYYLAIGSLGAGFTWFIYTFFIFLQNGTSETILAQHYLAPTSQTWDVVLSSASLAYLFLLLVPAYRLAKNWRYIEHLKKFGLQKTSMEYRLFVKKIAQQLGIKHTVHVYLSQLVQSPVTVGYLKPIILLPVAAINHLSPQQVEAVLLHELSHIKRYDYLVNFIIMLLRTLFYFNPFVKKFVSVIEFEREKCCDELVLQFEYDKVSYATALLLLEKNVLTSEVLTLAAAGKSYLLHRIEKILGLKKKAHFTLHQFAGIIASLLLVFFVNSLLVVKREVKRSNSHAIIAFENPLYQFDTPAMETFSKVHTPSPRTAAVYKKQSKAETKPLKTQPDKVALIPEQPNNFIMPVVYDITGEQVTPEEKAHIEKTLETTKKVLTGMKWKEVEASIGDGMTAKEKNRARKEYLKVVDQTDWKNLENQLKSNYQELDWSAITSKLEGALVTLKLDSLQVTYHQILTQIHESQATATCKTELPVPDATVKEVNALKNELEVKLDSIKVIQTHKTINF